MAEQHFKSQPEDAPEICDIDVSLPPSPRVSASCITASLPRHIPESRNNKWFFEDCVKLFYAATRGDWKAAKLIIDKDKTILRANIIRGRQTVLHVAAGATHVHFVEKLLKLLNKDDLVLQDQNGNTAFSCAVAAGTVPVANIMLQMNPRLLDIRGGQGRTPLYFAVLFGRGEMALYLYPKLIKDVDQGERAGIFFTSITNELYVLAFKMLHDYPELAVARDTNSETALHLLAGKPSAFAIKSSGIWKSFNIYSCNSLLTAP